MVDLVGDAREAGCAVREGGVHDVHGPVDGGAQAADVAGALAQAVSGRQRGGEGAGGGVGAAAQQGLGGGQDVLEAAHARGGVLEAALGLVDGAVEPAGKLGHVLVVQVAHQLVQHAAAHGGERVCEGLVNVLLDGGGGLAGHDLADGALLVVLVEGDARRAGTVGKAGEKVAREVLGEDHGGVVLAAAHALDGVLLARHGVADGGGLAQL